MTALRSPLPPPPPPPRHPQLLSGSSCSCSPSLQDTTTDQRPVTYDASRPARLAQRRGLPHPRAEACVPANANATGALILLRTLSARCPSGMACCLWPCVRPCRTGPCDTCWPGCLALPQRLPGRARPPVGCVRLRPQAGVTSGAADGMVCCVPPLRSARRSHA